MVAKTITLPNIRKLFLPDANHIICDCDFGQADARVVAWDADAPKLKAIFNDPTKDLHSENAFSIFGERALDEAGNILHKFRQQAKMGVHAVNYLITVRSLAKALGISIREAEHFMNAWFAAHPEIEEWHDSIEEQLMSTRTIQNAWGFRKVFHDRIDKVLTEAVAWIPQSTVAITINKALLNISRNLPEVEVLIQVHDSLVMQFHRSLYPAILPEIKKEMTIAIPYDDPLILPVDVQVSSLSWGHKTPVNWNGEFSDLKSQKYAGF